VFEIIDTDLDGVFDVAVSDLNDDDDISDEEIIDITDQNIKVSDLEDQETSEYCATGNDDDSECYTSDDDDDEGGVCAPDNGYTRTPTGTPARQQREEQAESDLPDYVNNANVKGLLKK